jgi:uncharacterized protein YggE
MRPPRALILLAVLATLLVPAAAQAADPTLSVVGQGTAFVTPDTADISASVRQDARTANAAREDVARRTNALLAALDRLGVPRADITTTSVGVSRQFNRKHRPKVTFRAFSSLAIHLTDATQAGPVLDALTAAGATDVGGPSFGFSNPSAGRAEAEAAALADARSRADAAAAAVGLRVVGVLAIDLDPGQGLSPLARGGADTSVTASAAPETPTPVQNGRQQVTAIVAVVYVLGS